jgi:glycerol uptake facilitator protein/aquaporin Z
MIAGLGPLSGGAVNPARQLGPAVLSGEDRFLWIYLIAPLVGAAIAGVVHTRLHRRPLLTHRLCGFDG